MCLLLRLKEVIPVVPFVLFATQTLPPPKIGLDQPIDEETVRQIGLAQMRRWIGDPNWPTVSIRRVGRCWLVTLTSPKPLSEDEILEPFALSLAPNGAILRANKYNPYDVESSLKDTCLRALVKGSAGQWVDITPALGYALPRLAARSTRIPKPFGRVALKLWGAMGETYAVDANGRVRRDGAEAGFLAAPMQIPAFTIPVRASPERGSRKTPPLGEGRKVLPAKRSPGG